MESLLLIADTPINCKDSMPWSRKLCRDAIMKYSYPPQYNCIQLIVKITKALYLSTLDCILYTNLDQESRTSCLRAKLLYVQPPPSQNQYDRILGGTLLHSASSNVLNTTSRYPMPTSCPTSFCQLTVCCINFSSSRLS